MITRAQSMVKFNERVLSLGKMTDKDISIKEVAKKFFFNKVFLSNMEEVFLKMNWWEGITSYMNALRDVSRNIGNIVKRFPFVYNCKSILVIRDLHQDRIRKDQLKNYPFKNGIYYLTFIADEIVISYLDENHSLYTNPIVMNGKYVKMDAYIKNSIAFMMGAKTYVVKASLNKRRYLVKMEYSDPSIYKYLSDTFKTSLVIKNKFLFMEDISNALKLNGGTLDPIVQETRVIRPQDIFEKDQIVQYPEESFDSYLNFLREVSSDSNVKSIMMTIYRIGKDPIIPNILKRAVLNGIDVYVNVELCASNEDINEEWVNDLRRGGVNVRYYSFKIMKVHAKLTLVKYNDGRSISQIGTGNYHTVTTKQYSDFSLYTADENICRQVEIVFDRMNDIRKSNIEFDSDFLITQRNFRKEFMNLINRESHEGGYIAIKCNSLDDERIIKALEKASMKGCKIDAIIRGICTWTPKSDNVTIKSIVWDKLEHARIFCFGSHNPTIYLGSLDLVENKINRRIETLVRIKDQSILYRLCDYMNSHINNTKNSWILKKEDYLKVE